MNSANDVVIKRALRVVRAALNLNIKTFVTLPGCLIVDPDSREEFLNALQEYQVPLNKKALMERSLKNVRKSKRTKKKGTKP